MASQAAGIQARFSSALADATAYYKPLIRSGSVKPLWHLMIFTSVVMYSQNYIFNKGVKVQKARKEQKLAMAEYYEKHGGGGHH